MWGGHWAQRSLVSIFRWTSEWDGILASHTHSLVSDYVGFPTLSWFGGRFHCWWTMTLNVISGINNQGGSQNWKVRIVLRGQVSQFRARDWEGPLHAQASPVCLSFVFASLRGAVRASLSCLTTCLSLLWFLTISSLLCSSSGTSMFSPCFPSLLLFRAISAVFTTGLASHNLDF